MSAQSFASRIDVLLGALPAGSALALLSSLRPPQGFAARVIQWWLFGGAFSHAQVIITQSRLHIISARPKTLVIVKNIAGDREVASYLVAQAGGYENFADAAHAAAAAIAAEGVTSVIAPAADVAAYTAPDATADAATVAAALQARMDLREADDQLVRLPGLCAGNVGSEAEMRSIVMNLGAAAAREWSAAHKAIRERQSRKNDVVTVADLTQEAAKAAAEAAAAAGAAAAGMSDPKTAPALAQPFVTVAYPGAPVGGLGPDFGTAVRPDSPAPAPDTAHGACSVPCLNPGVINTVCRPLCIGAIQAVIARTLLFFTPDQVNTAYSALQRAHARAAAAITAGSTLAAVHEKVGSGIRSEVAQAAARISALGTSAAASAAAALTAAAAAATAPDAPLGWLMPRVMDTKVAPAITATGPGADYVLRDTDLVVIWSSLAGVRVLPAAPGGPEGDATPANLMLADTYAVGARGPAVCITQPDARAAPVLDAVLYAADATAAAMHRRRRVEAAMGGALGGAGAEAAPEETTGRHNLRGRAQREAAARKLADVASRRSELIAELNAQLLRMLETGQLNEQLSPQTETAAETLADFTALSHLPDREMPRAGRVGVSPSLMSVFLPVMGAAHVPVHASYIKAATARTVDAAPAPGAAQPGAAGTATTCSELTLDLVALSKSGRAAKTTASLAQFQSWANAVFLRRLVFRFDRAAEAETAAAQIRDLLRQWEHAKKAAETGTAGAPAPAAHLTLIPHPPTLAPRAPVTVRPAPSRGTGATGLLQAHANGLRWIGRGTGSNSAGSMNRLDIAYDNIELVVLVEGTAQNATTVLHVHLRRPQPLAGRGAHAEVTLTRDFQFVCDAIHFQANLDDERRQRLDTEMRSEQRERESIVNANQQFCDFVDRLSESAAAWAAGAGVLPAGSEDEPPFNVDLISSDLKRIDDPRHSRETRALIEAAFENSQTMALEATAGRARQTVFFGGAGLYAVRPDLAPSSWVVIPAQSVLFAVAERVSNEREFDLVIVTRDWQHVQISCIRNTMVERIVTWTTLVAEAPVFFSAVSINYETFKDAILGVFEDGGNMLDILPDEESDESSAGEQESEWMASEEESSAVINDSVDEEFEFREESEFSVDTESVSDYESEGMDWDDMEAEAIRADARAEARAVEETATSTRPTGPRRPQGRRAYR